MHFRRRPPSSAAYGYDSPRPGEGYDADRHEAGDDGPASDPAGVRAHRFQAAAPQPAARGRGVPSGFQDPTWGQPASMPSDVRFTRTPDRILKERRRQAAGRFPDDEAAPADAVSASRGAETPPLSRPPL